MTKQEMIEKLKNNTEALCFLSEEEQAFLKANKDMVEQLYHGKFSHKGTWSACAPDNVYRLAPDFKLPLFIPDMNFRDPTICLPDALVGCALDCTSFHTKDVCPTINCDGCLCGCLNRPALRQHIAELGGQRKEAEFVECEIENNCGGWIFYYKVKQAYDLEEALGLVDFAGVKFKGVPGWKPYITKFNKKGLPIEPIAVRFVK